jgi:hypothetical protein
MCLTLGGGQEEMMLERWPAVDAQESHFTGGSMRHAVRWLTVTVVAAAALACSGTSEQSPREEATQGASADPKAACSLLTAEDINAVMGIAPGEPRFESNQCIWPRGDRPEELLVQLMVAPPSYRSYDDLARAYREQMDGADPAQAMEPLDGIGVGRFAVGFREMPMVQIYTDKALVQVSTFGNKREHALELAKRVARKRE